MLARQILLTALALGVLTLSAHAVVTSDEIGSHLTTPGVPAFGVNLDGVALLAAAPPGTESIGDLIPDCTGALITDRHILTAAHCYDRNGEDGQGDGDVDIEFAFYSVAAFEMPDRTVMLGLNSGAGDLPTVHFPDAWPELKADVAVIELTEDAPTDIPRYPLYAGTNEVGRRFVITGYGLPGYGATGQIVLPAISGVTSSTEAWDVNNAGMVVGRARFVDGEWSYALFWYPEFNEQGDLVGYAVDNLNETFQVELTSKGLTLGEAGCINDSGLIAGSTHVSGPYAGTDWGTGIFFCDVTGTLLTFLEFPYAVKHARALATNEDSIVVGYFTDVPTDTTHGFAWDTVTNTLMIIDVAEPAGAVYAKGKLRPARSQAGTWEYLSSSRKETGFSADINSHGDICGDTQDDRQAFIFLNSTDPHIPSTFWTLNDLGVPLVHERNVFAISDSYRGFPFGAIVGKALPLNYDYPPMEDAIILIPSPPEE